MAIGAEIPPAIAATAAGAAVAGAIEHSGFKDNALITKHELAGAAGGATAGVAAAVTADTMIAGAGIIGALATGTEMGAIWGSLGGPAGALAGAGLGAVIGMSAAAVGELFHWF